MSRGNLQVYRFKTKLFSCLIGWIASDFVRNDVILTEIIYKMIEIVVNHFQILIRDKLMI